MTSNVIHVTPFVNLVMCPLNISLAQTHAFTTGINGYPLPSLTQTMTGGMIFVMLTSSALPPMQSMLQVLNVLPSLQSLPQVINVSMQPMISQRVNYLQVPSSSHAALNTYPSSGGDNINPLSQNQQVNAYHHTYVRGNYLLGGTSQINASQNPLHKQ